MSDIPFLLQLITGTVIGLGAGYLGSFMVLRRMSLVGDALSHVALPGIAIALILHINPFIGAFTTLFLAILLIWFLERRTTLPSETLVGIMFIVSLAVGLLLTPEPELLEALFGDITKIGAFDLILSVVLVAYVIYTMRKIEKGFVLSIISQDLARTSKFKVDTINFMFLTLVAVVVAIGLKVAGTVLMGSLVIIPAAAAKNVSVTLNQYTAYASAIGAVCAFTGILIASNYNLAPGPIIILTGGLVFLGTLISKQR